MVGSKGEHSTAFLNSVPLSFYLAKIPPDPDSKNGQCELMGRANLPKLK